MSLAQESYWLDELSALNVVKSSWQGVYTHLSTKDVHPPLYFALLKLWTAVFGTSEVATRSLSVLAGVSAIAFAFLLARRLFGPRPALAAALMLAASPFCVYYAREARAYSLLLALTLASTWLFVRAAPEFRPRSVAAYVAVAALLPYTHVFGIFTLGAQAVTAAWLLGTGRMDRRAALRAGLGFLAVLLAFLPWLPVFLAQTRRVQDGFWIPRPRPGVWLYDWTAEGPASIAWVLLLLALAVAGLLQAYRRSRSTFLLLALSIALPSLVPLALSCLSQPIFMAKYAIGASGVLCVAVASVPLFQGRWGWIPLVVLAGLGTGETIRDVYFFPHKADWRGLAHFASIEAGSRKIPLVLTVKYASHLSNYLEPGVTLWPVGRRELAGDAEHSLAARLSARGADRFWLLNVHPDRTDPALEPLFREHWVPVETRTFYGAEAILWLDAQARAGHPKHEGVTP